MRRIADPSLFSVFRSLLLTALRVLEFDPVHFVCLGTTGSSPAVRPGVMVGIFGG